MEWQTSSLQRRVLSVSLHGESQIAEALVSRLLNRELGLGLKQGWRATAVPAKARAQQGKGRTLAATLESFIDLGKQRMHGMTCQASHIIALTSRPPIPVGCS